MDNLFPLIAETPMWLFIVAIVSFLALVVSLILLVRSENESKVLMRAVTVTGFLAVVVAIMLAIWVWIVETNNDKAYEEAVKSQVLWVVSHGVTPDAKGFKDLNFPDVKPIENKEFGIAQVVKDKEIVTIRLAWENDEFVLYDTDGQPLKQIK